MMAAYWKSPYKESSYFSNRGSTSGSSKFDQPPAPLSFNRAKTSILSSGQDLLGWHSLPTQWRPGSSQQYQRQVTSSNLKGILKPPKERISLKLRTATETEEKSVEEDIDSDPKSDTYRSSKRVSFGPNDETTYHLEDDESEYSGSNTGARDSQSSHVTLQRISHSRQVEETAMQKLNKLIAGFHASKPGTTQSSNTNRTGTGTKISSLPVVDGRGLLTSKLGSFVYKSPGGEMGKHKSDARSMEYKSTYNNSPRDKLDHASSLQQSTEKFLAEGFNVSGEHILKPSNSVQFNKETSIMGNKDGQSNEESNSMTVKVNLPITLFDDGTSRLPETFNSTAANVASPRKRSISRKPKPVVFQKKRFQSKILPGRYPFTSGTVHIQDPSVISKKNGHDNKKNNSSINQTLLEKSDTICDNNKATSETETNAENRLQQQELSQEVEVNSGEMGTKTEIQRDVSSKKQIPESSISTQSSSMVVASEIVPEEMSKTSSSVPIMRPRGNSRDSRYMDKTSQILTWLKDVKQKRDFKPRNTRFIVIESKSLH